MSDIAIRVEDLGKQYRLGPRQRYRALRDTLTDVLYAPFRAVRSRFQRRDAPAHLAPVAPNLIWALRHVSCDIRRGEVVGIIGRNGAGKSTLLKILSRITEPTEGRAEIRGRVGSLLEVGTGFHPELTGRENIYLNGAVLGMLRREIQRKFDEIVAFAEVEAFIDTPVKHYSSGMYMRLAFAVAAHLEPEILLVDEVLAVGDAAFQKKCLGKMGEVAQGGRTVLFVSHNMAAIQNLCRTGIVLNAGQVQFVGPIEQAVAHYLQDSAQPIRSVNLRDRHDRQGDGALRFTQVQICDQAHQPLDIVLTGQELNVCLEYEARQADPDAQVVVAFNVYNAQGVLLTNLNSRDVGRTALPVTQRGYFECRWPKFNLRSGVYTCALFCELNGNIADWLQSAFQIQVEDGDFFGTGSVILRSQGEFLVPYDWRSVPAEN
jgi:lipopolysaccharide transport system ATP-binding protein